MKKFFLSLQLPVRTAAKSIYSVHGLHLLRVAFSRDGRTGRQRARCRPVWSDKRGIAHDSNHDADKRLPG